MATQVQIRRGTSTQVAAFTGAEGEIVVNTTNDSIHVNDGSSAGGVEMARADLNNVSDTDLNAALTGNTVSALTVTALTADGLTVDGSATISGAATAGFVTPLLAKNPSTNAASSVKIGLDAGGTTWGEIGASYNTNDPYMAFFVRSGSEKVRITDAGNCGIGTSSPSTKLHLGGTAPGDSIIRQDSTASGTNWEIGEREAGKWQIFEDDSDSIVATFMSSGNFGIGNSSPDSVLTAVNAASTAALRIGLNNTSFNYMDADNNIFRSGAGTERMRIDSSGRQIIGHTASVGTAYQTNLQVKGSTASNYPGLGVISTNNEMLGVVGTWSNGENSLMIAADPDNLRPSSSIVFTTDATEAMRIDQNGTLLLTTPVGGAYGYLNIKEAGNGDVRFGMESGINYDAIAGTFTNNGFKFYTNSTLRMTLDSSGRLLVGTTSPAGKVTVYADSGVGQRIQVFEVAPTVMEFRNSQNSGGSITIASGGGTSYNTSSDQRLKENIVDAPSASDDIDAIQVRSFDWKVDGSHQKYGMVAQELNTVAPVAVSVPEDPNEMMGIDYSKLVPMLVKEIQSLRSRVQQLENN